MYDYSNRKKVRGWRRRVKELGRWRDAASRLDVDMLMRREALWVKIQLDPWNRSTPRNPPMWFRRLVLAALIDIHGEWHARLAPLGIPFVLRVWLMQPRFHSSQVVAAVGSKLEHYADLFLAFPDADPASIDAYRSSGIPLDDLTWRPCIDADIVVVEDEEIDGHAAHAFSTARLGQATIHFLDRGTLWVGEKREEERRTPIVISMNVWSSSMDT